MARVKPTNKGTLDNLDYGISYLLEKGVCEKAIHLLEHLLLTHPDDLTMQVFDSTTSAILHNKGLTNIVVTRWFLSGDRVLCDGVHAIILAHHGEGLPLEIDPAELKPADCAHILFVARKAIGYLFIQPISAASVLISLMRNTTDDRALRDLGALLLDPLLLNFTGKVRDYAVQQSELASGKVKATIEDALKGLDKYLEDLRSVGNLAALHSAETQREAYHRHFLRIMTESCRAAEAESVLLKLVSKSVLLYGRKSIDYVYGPDGQSRRMEIPLQSHGMEMEFPRMQILDPFGLDYMLRVFRNERLKA